VAADLTAAPPRATVDPQAQYVVIRRRPRRNGPRHLAGVSARPCSTWSAKTIDAVTQGQSKQLMRFLLAHHWEARAQHAPDIDDLMQL